MSGLSAAQQLTSFTIIPTAAQGNQQPKYQKVDRNDNIVQPKIIYAPGAAVTSPSGAGTAYTQTQNQQAGKITCTNPTDGSACMLTVTNSFCTTTSLILVTVAAIAPLAATETVVILSAVAGAGSFVINFLPNAAVTSVTFGYQIIN
jgi:hypothetical protein